MALLHQYKKNPVFGWHRVQYLLTGHITMIYKYHTNNSDIAKALYDAGLSIVPIKCDGSKRPPIKWRQYSNYQMPWFQLRHWFRSKGKPSGIGIICGIASGNLEVLDFDEDAETIFPQWSNEVGCRMPDLLNELPIVETPSSGFHLYYRCEAIEGNQKLAQRKVGDELLTLIETRGQGGLVVAPGSPLITHRLRKPYHLLQGDLKKIPTISTYQRNYLHDIARSFNEYKEEQKPQQTDLDHNCDQGRTQTNLCLNSDKGNPLFLHEEIWDCVDERPGDRFNRLATWDQILEPHGWTISHTRGNVIFWRRPNKYDEGHSATTGYGGDYLYVFSSNAEPFDENTGYRKFTAYSILNHNGDRSQAAKSLLRERKV